MVHTYPYGKDPAARPERARSLPALRDPPARSAAGRSREPGDRGRRRGRRAVHGAGGGSHDAAPDGGDRRLPLRGRMVGHRPALGGCRLRGLLSSGHPSRRSHPGTVVTHVVFEGLDRYRSIVVLEDALAEDVLLADRLDGAPLGPDHGAPVRLVSPQQYGFMSTKHLCRIELHTEEPPGRYHPSWRIDWGAAGGQAPSTGPGVAGGAAPLPARPRGATDLPPPRADGPVAQSALITPSTRRRARRRPVRRSTGP